MEKIKAFYETVEYYKKYLDYFGRTEEISLLEPYTIPEYIAVQTKLMLLRKYITPNKDSNKVYLLNVINSLGEYEITSGDKLKKIYGEIERLKDENSDIKISLANGKSYNLFKIIELEMYGLMLHGDTDKLDDLRDADQDMMFICKREFVSRLETLVLDLFDLIKENNIVTENTCSSNKKVVIRTSNNGNEQNVTQSPLWGNIYGTDCETESVQEIVDCYSKDDISAMSTAMEFISNIEAGDINVAFKYVHPYTEKRFKKSYQECRALIDKCKNLGFSTKVRYNERNDIAYVYAFDEVIDAFSLTEEQIVRTSFCISLVKNRTSHNQWKVYQIGEKLDDYKLSGTIRDYIKTLIKRGSKM